MVRRRARPSRLRMSPNASTSSNRRGLGRLAVFYVLFGASLVLGARYVPLVRSTIAGGATGDIGGTDVGQLFGAPPVGQPLGGDPWTLALLAAASMLGALTIMVPVTWVYMITRRRRGYVESVVHTLLILPVAVTGIVMIVKNSVALAFSLAGIVAAVRFRTTLEDTKDAVYVFLAIGVGLACGVQAVGVALVLSIVFNGVVLVLWRTQFGNIYADRNVSGRLGLGDVLAGPESGATALVVGDPAILDAASPKDLAEVAERSARMERYLSNERGKKKSKRANTLLLVHAPAAEPAQTLVDGILGEIAVRFECVEVGPGPRGWLLEYVARLDGEAGQGALVDRLRREGDGVVTAAEIRSLKGLKPRA
jgi:hypothetical protein